MNLIVTREQHVALSYGILAALLLAAAFALLRVPVGDRLAFVGKLDAARTTYAKSEGAIRRNETVRAALERRQAESDLSSELFDAETAALAGAELQNDLRGLIESEQGVLVSSAFRQLSEKLPLTPVTVEVRLHCSVESLVRILQGLESHHPTLFVENVVVQSRHTPGRAIGAANEELDVEFDVTGYLDRPSAP